MNISHTIRDHDNNEKFVEVFNAFRDVEFETLTDVWHTMYMVNKQKIRLLFLEMVERLELVRKFIFYQQTLEYVRTTTTICNMHDCNRNIRNLIKEEKFRRNAINDAFVKIRMKHFLHAAAFKKVEIYKSIATPTTAIMKMKGLIDLLNEESRSRAMVDTHERMAIYEIGSHWFITKYQLKHFSRMKERYNHFHFDTTKLVNRELLREIHQDSPKGNSSTNFPKMEVTDEPMTDDEISDFLKELVAVEKRQAHLLKGISKVVNVVTKVSGEGIQGNIERRDRTGYEQFSFHHQSGHQRTFQHSVRSSLIRTLRAAGWID